MRIYLLFIMLLIFSCNVSAEDARFYGHALWQFENVGAWGWVVSVDQIIDGPADMVGDNISVYVSSADPRKYPPGHIDQNITVGDNVSVYGWLQGGSGNYHILLVGSKDYYIKPAILEEARAKAWWQFW